MKSLMLRLGSLMAFSAARAQVDTSRYTIDNCVNEFTISGIESTEVGYQYWFVNRDFLDGRTLKMSVVAPHEATHPPHNHAEDECGDACGRGPSTLISATPSGSVEFCSVFVFRGFRFAQPPANVFDPFGVVIVLNSKFFIPHSLLNAPTKVPFRVHSVGTKETLRVLLRNHRQSAPFSSLTFPLQLTIFPAHACSL